MRALMLRARGVSVFVGDRQRTGWQMLADTVMAACLLAFANEIIAYAWQVRFHIGSLVTGGVYRWTRHPIYVAFDLLFVGTFLLLGRLSFLVLALVWVPLLHAIMNREERLLTGLYGDAYRDYSRRVGRYFFRQQHE